MRHDRPVSRSNPVFSPARCLDRHRAAGDAVVVRRGLLRPRRSRRCEEEGERKRRSGDPDHCSRLEAHRSACKSRSRPSSTASSVAASEIRAQPRAARAEAFARREREPVLGQEALGGQALRQLEPDVERSLADRARPAAPRATRSRRRLVARAALLDRVLRAGQRCDPRLLHGAEDAARSCGPGAG